MALNSINYLFCIILLLLYSSNIIFANGQLSVQPIPLKDFDCIPDNRSNIPIISNETDKKIVDAINQTIPVSMPYNTSKIDRSYIHDNYSCLILIGGPYANDIVKGYNDHRQGDYIYNGTINGFINTVDNTIYESLTNDPPVAEDLFVIQAFRDNKTDILMIYGVGDRGTIAAGKYFIEIMYPNKDIFVDSAYIFHWKDDESNRDSSPLTDEGALNLNEITLRQGKIDEKAILRKLINLQNEVNDTNDIINILKQNNRTNSDNINCFVG